ncbi:low temperature requirement protein A [Embleya scabrispora]|uniref:low temperature requirement protein A n=1 Tax=Embleya scabrispora TaxID=159449 RepID=UPI0013750005|nr:low temperature requirement protein A [Embleya scabrispora]
MRVSTLELFFDLVFVFTVTQLTAAIAHELNPTGITRVVLMLALIWWMYSGYVWLTNTVPPTTPVRQALLMVGMAGFLVVALAVPHAFDGTGEAFGFGYLMLSGVHFAMFLASGGTRRAFVRIAPFNMSSTALIVVGGFLDTTAQLAVWAAALVVQIITPYVAGNDGFRLSVPHFVERHGLVVIVALGESVIAIGVGAQGLALNATLIATAASTLTVCFAIWWAYFGAEDDERAVAVLERLEPKARNLRALNIYGYVHYGLLLGMLLFAAGVKGAMARPSDRLDTVHAGTLVGGLALYLASVVATRRAFRITPNGYRIGAVMTLLATIPIGRFGSALVQIAAIAAILIAYGMLETRHRHRHPGPLDAHTASVEAARPR